MFLQNCKGFEFDFNVKLAIDMRYIKACGFSTWILLNFCALSSPLPLLTLTAVTNAPGVATRRCAAIAHQEERKTVAFNSWWGGGGGGEIPEFKPTPFVSAASVVPLIFSSYFRCAANPEFCNRNAFSGIISEDYRRYACGQYCGFCV